VWKRLPVEQRAIHGMYSGAEVFVLLDDPELAPAENRVQLPLPGELLYFFDEGSGAVGRERLSPRFASCMGEAWCCGA